MVRVKLRVFNNLSYLSLAAWFGHFPGFFHRVNLVEPLRVLRQVKARCCALIADHAERPVWLSQVQFLYAPNLSQF